MHSKFYTFFVPFLFLLALSVSLEASSKKEVLSYLNATRVASGLIPFRHNSFLEKAATSHAKYIIRNQISGHTEKKGKYSYSGRKPSKRVRNAGYGSSFTMENISINAKNEHDAIDTLFSAIYHRFVFLNMEHDEIGLGAYSTSKKRRLVRAYVYNFGASSIVKMCKKKYKLTPKTYYTNHVCKKDATVVPWSIFESNKAKIRIKNMPLILYPYAGQTEVSPAFYNESPDPLPGYKVSGFPVSVQFNESNYKKVKLLKFRLYDEGGKEIKKVKILHKKNDRNHLFSAYEFALMPLKRLEYNTKYSATFSALVDGKKVEKHWVFKTKSFKEKFYRLTEKKKKLTVKKGDTLVLYSVPMSKKDILKNYSARGGLKVSFLDQNTLKIHFTRKGKATLKLSNKRTVSFTIK